MQKSSAPTGTPHDRFPLPDAPRAVRLAVAFGLGALAVATGWMSSPMDKASRTAVASAAVAPALTANMPDAPPLPAAAVEQQGLTLTFYKPGEDTEAAGAGDSRSARMAALYVPAGSAPSVFMPPGPFVAVWRADLNLRLRDDYAFALESRGKVTVTVNGQPAVQASGDATATTAGEPVRLNKGKNKLVIRYESPAVGDAQVRLMWKPKDEPLFEPIPPTVFTHDIGEASIAKGLRAREGRFLVAQYRCTHCHTGPAGVVAAAGMPVRPSEAIKTDAMPELAMDAPSLNNLGARLNRAWMAAWISDPRLFRADAHMPRLFHAGNGSPKADAGKPFIEPRAVDVATYLTSLGDKPAPAAEPTPEQAATGGKLFTHLNCLACHTPPDAAPGAGTAAAPTVAPEPAAGGDAQAENPDAQRPRVPLKFVKAKFQPAALKAYLLNPHAHYAWNPMPNFKLSDDDATALSAFLLTTANGEPPVAGELPAGDAGKGKQLLASAGCVQCHAMKETPSTLKVAALNEIGKEGWFRGCMAKDDATRKGAPDFHLTDAERTTIVAFAATDRTSLTREAAPEFAERQVSAMGCVACHARDGRESLLATVYDTEQKEWESKFPAEQAANEADAFSPDQRPPQLTYAGDKLRPEWMASFIAGEIPYKPRTYLRARMPVFTARAGLLSAGLAEGHGVTPTAPPPEAQNAELAAVGRKLTGKTPNEAFSCTQCHAVAKNPPFAPFEAPALNFAYVSDRLRKDYYHRWIHNPLRIDPNTKMPAFERDDGKTPISTVYDGDARRQFEAIWQYLLSGSKIQPPPE